MNIHSYDALLIALVMAGFLVMTMARREATGVWIVRALTIGAGALPAAPRIVFGPAPKGPKELDDSPRGRRLKSLDAAAIAVLLTTRMHR